MNKTILALTLASLGLAGCGGDEQTVNRADRTPADLYFSYPAADQAALATTTPIFLRFTQPISVDEGDLTADLLRLESEHGDAIPLTGARLTKGSRGIALHPAEPLQPGTRYTLSNNGLAVGSGEVQLPGGGIQFTTAPATTGPLLDRTEGSDFRLARVIPAGNDVYPVTDMSVLRLQFTEPVAENSLRYGETISLLDGNNQPVDAELYVQGHLVTVDPAEDLAPNQSYTLDLTDGIRSTLADAPLNLPEDTPWTFTPLDSNPPDGTRARMAQTATTDIGSLALSGREYNSVNLRSLLLGSDNTTRAQGTVFAELGFIPRFEAAGRSVPLRIDQGTLMTGSSVAVKVAGALPAGFSSEDIEVRFLSDANGFLMANPYTDYDGAPRLVELYIDMALNTGNPIANAALAQELLHVHLVGTALVEDGSLSIEAVGVIEPEVMGVDTASGLISFRLEGYRNPDNAPPEASFADNRAPTVKSWVPGPDHQDKIRPGDPLIVYFSEPVLPGSVDGDSVMLRDGNGADVAFEHTLNGATLTVRPTEPLSHGQTYTLNLDSGIRDLAGHPIQADSLAFALAATDASNPEAQAPLVLTSRPGYPCAKVGADPLAGHQGRCDGGNGSDDLLPVMGHGLRSPIVVRFSQTMDEATFVAGQTVTVEEYVEGSWQPVDPALYVVDAGARSLTITPLQAWTEGRLYRYTLGSAPDGAGSIVRSHPGLPLQTRILSQSYRALDNRAFGGPDLVNYFVAAPEPAVVFNPLRNLPSRDANGDLELAAPEQRVTADGQGEYHATDNSARLEVVPGSVSSDLVTGANIGCPVGQDCPDRNFIYKTAMLDVDVAGRVDGAGRVPVNIYPSKLYTTGVDFWVSIDDTPLAICLWLCSAASLVGGADQHIPTGPMVMRIRHAGADRAQPVPGFISTHPDTGALWFETELDVYMDAPYLHPDIDLTDLDHNMRSFPINGIQLEGPITFLDDGRMQIHLANSNPLDLGIAITGNVLGGLGDVFVGSPNTALTLRIPPGELVLNYVSPYTQP